MRRLLFGAVGVCGMAGLPVFLPLAGTSAAAPTDLLGLPVGLVSLTTSTPATETFTFQGGNFNGTASGTSTNFPLQVFGNNRIPVFTVTGPALTGTCSGQWLVGPFQGALPWPPAFQCKGARSSRDPLNAH